MPESEPVDVPAGLARLAEQRFGAGARVAGLRRLSGGASQELWAFDVEQAGAIRPLILRRNPDGAARAGAVSMETEARLIRLAAAAGAPVPVVVHVLEPQDGLGRGFVMERVPGESLAPRILRDPAYAQARPGLARQLGQAAARIHAVTGDDLPSISPQESLQRAQTLYQSVCGPRPVMAWALRWLAEHLPPQGPTTVVHGDLRNGNIIVGSEGLRAVLDWEGVHRGDPMEDLAWLCVPSWRFGEIDKPVGGFGSRDELFDGYEEAGGAKVDPERVRFWEVMGVLRWGLICATMAAEAARGDRSVEKAAIGRRVSETELDLLAMLSPPEEAGALRERPSAQALAAAVAGFLREPPAPGEEDRHAFHARVAANALDVVAREIALGPPALEAEAARLHALLQTEGEGEALNARLCERIASGAIDPADPALVDHLWRTTLDTVAIDQPRYATYRRLLAEAADADPDGAPP